MALILSVQPSTGDAPLMVAFSGLVLDRNGDPAPGKQLKFSVNGTEIGGPGPITTDADGAFAFRYIFQNPGNFSWTIAET